MFSLLRELSMFSMLSDSDPATVTDEMGGLSGYTAQTNDHYLYFRGIPNPPDAYIPPTGASTYTWPNIYNNLLDIDFCVDHFSHLGNRVKCMETFQNAGPMLS
mmetsp:Transcript_44131/g.92328  ORF Transcript_44131/g.92328 Transcript_44131/m.92328 type:complete len:103 (-) Transcript_44131:165-473(-)